ncbi:MAG: chemotaxis protein CheW [Gammaproteobacteria bacterium]
MTAFSYLNQLDQRFSSESGSVLASGSSVMRTLHFRVGRYDLLLPLDDTTEIISQISYSRIPISRPWMLGIASRRGQLLTLIDLKNFLFNSDPVKKVGKQRIIANKVGTNLLGFVVDHAVGLMNLQKSEFKDSYPEHWDNGLVNYLSGIYEENDVYYGVCDFNKMINDERFTETQKNYN